jgi:BNR repeat-like domain
MRQLRSIEGRKLMNRPDRDEDLRRHLYRRPAVWSAIVACLTMAFIAALSARLKPTIAAQAPTRRAAHPSEPFMVRRLEIVSGPSPFAAGCPGALGDDTKITGLVIEPAIAADPADPRNLIAAWKQDVSSEFNGRGDMVASSRDSGKTWRSNTIPGLTRCTGGTADTASDPWVSFGGDGTAYFGGQAGSLSSDPPPIAIVASHAMDRGRHWSAPASVAPPLGGNEQPAITGSPTRRGHAYMIWANFSKTIPATRTYTVEFSRTTNGGETWSPPARVSEPGPFAIDLAPRIRVLPNGTLLAIFARADFLTGLAELRIARSLDEGRTWLPAVVAGSFALPGEFFDPETGEQLPQPGYPTSAVAPDGTVYVAFENSTSADSGAIGLAISRDGGLTWRTSRLPGVNAFAFEPAIAVDAQGTVGVMWYDLRNDRRGDAATTADVWFAHSADRGASWRQIHVAGPTDLRTGAPPDQNRFGEYQGMTGLRRGFAAIFGLASPQAKNGPTDIFFARLGPDDDDDDR